MTHFRCINEGNKHLSENNLDKAIAYYDEAISINPKYVLAYTAKGLTLEKQDKLDEAIDCYDKAISLDSKHVGSYCSKGTVLEKQNKLKEAIGCYDIAISINPNYARAFCNRGIVLEQIGKKAEAIEDLNRVEKLVQSGNQTGLSCGHLKFIMQSLKKRKELEKTLEDVQAQLLSSQGYTRQRKEALDEVVTLVKREIGTVFVKQQTQILGPVQVQEPIHPVENIELKDVVKEVTQKVVTQAKEIVGVQGMVVDQQGEIEELKDRVHVLEEMFANLTAKNS